MGAQPLAGPPSRAEYDALLARVVALEAKVDKAIADAAIARQEVFDAMEERMSFHAQEIAAERNAALEDITG